MKLEHDKRWSAVGRRLTTQAKKLWPKRYTHPEKFSLLLHDVKRMELYKDMGYGEWDHYRYGEWGPRFADVNHWERVAPLLTQVPQALRLAPPGAVSIRAVALFAPFCETKEDVLWWGRLARVTTHSELTRIVEAQKQAFRCGIPGTTSYLLAFFCYGHHYTGVVSDAVRKARQELGEDTQLGVAIAWACARALGRPLPRPLGVDPRDLRGFSFTGRHSHLVGGPAGGVS